MKKKANRTLIVITLMVVVIAVMQFFGLFKKKSADADPTATGTSVQASSEYDYIMNYDYVGNYPEGPAKVIELNNRIMMFLYGDRITEDQIPEIIKKQRHLFSIDLLGLNSLDIQTTVAIQQITEFRDTKLKILKILAESPVYDLIDVNMCTVTVTQYISNSDNQFVKYNLINEDGQYKIYSWDNIDILQGDTNE